MSDNIVQFPPRRPTIHNVLGTGGITREVRPGQIAMAELAERAMLERRNAIVEGGTGTGKGLGYLVPAIVNSKRIVVSTATKALQAQLANKDLPELLGQLRERFGIFATFAVLKGARNYVCRQKHDDLQDQEPKEVFAWVESQTIADLDDAPAWIAPEWRKALGIDLDECAKKGCPFYEVCDYRQARAAAEASDVVIVNHAILALSLVNPFLLNVGSFQAVVVDEAHKWADIVRGAFGGKLSMHAVKNLCASIEKHVLSERHLDTWEGLKKELRSRLGSMFNLPVLCGQELIGLMDRRLDVTDKLLSKDDVEAFAAPASEALADLADWVRPKLVQPPEKCDWAAWTEAQKKQLAEHQRIERTLEGLEGFFSGLQGADRIAVAHRKLHPDDDYATVSLESLPLEVGASLQGPLYGVVPVIYASATIAEGDDFTAAKVALGLGPTTLEAVLPSPFDYDAQSLLYVPRDIPDPSEKTEEARIPRLCEEISTLVKLSRGRAFVLFTSNRMMRIVFDRLQFKLGFPCKLQDQTPKQALIEWFKDTPGAVLFAVGSFWEGVSIEGDQLSLVIIDKVPFVPHNDPIYEAKSQQVKRRGANPFNVLSVPNAITHLKQGFGRLVRNQTDRGVVAILDSRLTGKYYGQRILNALPPARRVHTIDTELIASYFVANEAPAVNLVSPIAVEDIDPAWWAELDTWFEAL